MKCFVLITCFVLSFIFSSQPIQAQNQRYQNSQVREMVQTLDGGSSHNHGNVAKRSAVINQSVQPRGIQSSSSSREYQYHVDSSCRLCTTEIKFEKGSISLADNASLIYLKNLAEALMDSYLHGQRYVVEGHASAEGSSTSNQILSQRRANAIYDYLVRQGVSSSRLIAVGHGESHARFPSQSPNYLLSKDRRVMVYKLAQ